MRPLCGLIFSFAFDVLKTAKGEYNNIRLYRSNVVNWICKNVAYENDGIIAQKRSDNRSFPAFMRF